MGLAVVAVDLVINARGAASIMNVGVPYDVLEHAVPIHPNIWSRYERAMIFRRGNMKKAVLLGV